MAKGVAWGGAGAHPRGIDGLQQLLAAMERGAGLHGAVAEVRRHLEHDGPASSQMLLSAYGNGQSDDIHLPLRKRRQFLRRLATSQRLLSPPPPACWSRASTA